MSTLLIKNVRIVSPDYDVCGASVLIENDRIKHLYVGGDKLPAADTVFDGQGNMLMPGFIDVHCHGQLGADFCDADAAGAAKILAGKLAEGVTSMLPTTLTLSKEQLTATLKAVADAVKQPGPKCKVPGVHLEGPFFNPKFLGAQNPAYVRTPDTEEVVRLNSIYPVRKISYAVEMPKGPEFTADMISMGITPSCVHSGAKIAEFNAGYDRGLRNLSHFCNQMSALHHRDIGLVGAGLLHDDVSVELICDKLHISVEMIQLTFKVKGAEGIQLITDALRTSGMPDGEYDLGGLPIHLRNGEARLDGGNLAGSCLKLNKALQNVAEITGLPLKELVKATSYNQAQALGLEKTGKVAPGYFADLALLDANFDVQAVFVDGKQVR